MAAARRATEALATGGRDRLGSLHGVPVSIKDVTPVAGLAWTFGSPLFADQVATEDALIVQRLKAAGAIVVGKTNTPDFAFGGVTDNALFGPTRNPWDTRMTAGGSTGGGAAAIAAGMGPLAQGGDLGGSLRTPASFCGIVGFRSSPGLVPIWPNPLPWDANIVEGTMALTVEDAALSLAAIAGPDSRAPLSFPCDTRRFLDAVAAPDIRGWRVAWTPDLDGVVPVDSDVQAAVARAAEAFRELGATVERAAPGMTELMDAVLPTRGLIMAALHADKLSAHRDRLPPALVWNVEQGLALTPEAILKGERARGLLTARAAEFFARYDILLLPTEAVVPFPVGTAGPESINGVALDNPIHWFALAYAATALGLPALAVPGGFSAGGLPIGVQIVAGHRREEDALRAGAAYEAARPWAHVVPPCVAAARD
jgi:amidase